MTSVVSRRLVIDASVARAAGGEDATFPISKYCRDFLSTTLTICHHIVMTPEIENEWKRHQSAFARKWRRYMEGKKKIYRLKNAVNNELRRKFENISIKDTEKEVMLKDIHLIEAALVTDKIVISLDEEARELFYVSSTKLGELKDAIWINPGKLEEKSIVWLENGANNEKHRHLGYRDD